MKVSPLVATGAVLLLVSIAASVAVYDRLPDPVPTHFDVQGRADGFTSKPFGAFIGAIVILFVTLVFMALPKISPRGFLIDRFRRVYEIVCSAIIGFVFFVSLLALSAAIGWHAPFDRLAMIAIGILLLILGNFMGKLTRNFFIGIRTPWTLASDEVWFRTHRLGGRLFVLAALVLFLGVFLGVADRLLVIVIVAVGVWLTAYSYVIYRRIEGAAREDDVSSSEEPKEKQ